MLVFSNAHIYRQSLKLFYNSIRYMVCNIQIRDPELDLEYLCNVNNRDEINNNIKNRKGVGDIDKVLELKTEIDGMSDDNPLKSDFIKKLQKEAQLIPNRSFPDLIKYGDQPKILNVCGNKPNFLFKPKEFSAIAKKLNLLRTENLGVFSGHRSYYLLGELAELEQALIHFSIDSLVKKDFNIISVPDVLPRIIIESCGMNTKGERTQVYSLDTHMYGDNLCLSGTSEMAIAGYLANSGFHMNELPKKIGAVSRCYRAETSSIHQERGIFRVHQFTKVEMFGVTDSESSTQLLDEFCAIQKENFSDLGLHFQTLDMPLVELGASAYRKYDIEVWMPGCKMFGEVSSTSNCTDYQSRRLNIKYYSTKFQIPVHVHTINGTACAIPRMLIALLETYQQEDGTVLIPEVLKPYMKGKSCINKQTNIPSVNFIKTQKPEIKIR